MLLYVKNRQVQSDRCRSSQLTGRSFAVERPSPVHSLQGLLLNPGKQDSTGRNIMDQTNDLTSSPDLMKKLVMKYNPRVE